MSKYLSRKIKFITVFAMTAVVFIHSYNYSDSFLTPATRISEGFAFAPMLEYFFSNELLRFAVPLFFLISGFLFFFNYENTPQCYENKLKKRFSSLLVPYLIWAILSGLTVVILSHFAPFQELDIIKERAVDLKHFLIYLVNPPAFQLWYIQQLIIFTVLAPAMYWLLKKTKGLILAPVGILWLFNLSFIVNSEALFFFWTGAAFAVFKKHRNVARKSNRMLTVITALIWLSLSLANTLIAALGSNSFAVTVIMTLLYKLNQAVGVAAVWLIFDHIAKRISHKKAMLLASAHLFMVYVLHEPLLHICYQLALKQSSVFSGHLILYICLPLSITALCIIVSMVLRKVAKPIHKYLTGGRQQ